jgi:uncharacterized protein with von Willebrand factor type A (vWA) domain
LRKGERRDSLSAPTRRRLAGFGRTLRDNGFRIGLAETRDALAILTSPAAIQPTLLKPALRALFCATYSDWERFDEVFDAFWLGRSMRQRLVLAGMPSAPHAPPRRVAEAHVPQAALGLTDHAERRSDDNAETPADSRGRREGASRTEVLTTTDLRHIVDPDDIAATHALAARLAHIMRVRLVRREQIRKRGRRLDLRRTIHRNISHGFRPFSAWRGR